MNVELEHPYNDGDGVAHDHRSRGPGEVLREARESKGLDVVSVANHLNLHRSTIEALENDDFDQLPETIFIRGYIRNYARLLGVDAAGLLERFEVVTGAVGQQGGGEQSVGLRGHHAESLEHPPKGVSLLWLLVLVLVIAVVLVVWWQSDRLFSSQSSGSTVAAVDPSAAVAPPLPGVGVPARSPLLPQQPEPLVAVEAQTDPLVPVPDANESLLAESGESSAGNPDDGEAVALNGDGDGAQTEPRLQSDEQLPSVPEEESATETAGGDEMQRQDVALASETGSAERAAVPTPSPVAESSAPGSEQIAFTLIAREDCWTEVTDATGRRRVARVVPADSELELEGLAPMRLVLGNAAGVEVRVSGRTYDFTPFVSGNIARFTLDADLVLGTDR